MGSALLGRRFFPIILPFLAGARLLLAAGAAPASAVTSSGEAQELHELMGVLAKETEIATKTKMNRDFVPGMVTVLDHDSLEALGAQTVLDALSLVPGLQVFRELSGAPNISPRGIGYPFNAGNIKVMINSVAISREEAGVNSAGLLTRIEQVDRIEVIRGPSSSIHGAFAFAGVVNIITRNTGSRVYSTAGTGGHGALGGNYSWDTEDQDWKFSLNAAGYRGKDGEGPAGLYPEASGSTSVFQAQHEKFSLLAEYLKRDDSFLDPLSGRRPVGNEQTLAFEARQGFDHSPTLSSELRLTHLGNDIIQESIGQRFTGNRVEGSYDLNWKPSSGHRVLLGLDHTRSQIDDASLVLPGPPLPPLIRSILVDQQRRTSSVTLQDQIDLGDRLTLTLGERFDDYSDVGSRLTPRIGAVFRADSENILKAQYTEGFRPPTFWERYASGAPDPNLTFEVIKTSELGYVLHKEDTVARLTAFRSSIDDVLYPVLPPPGPGPTIFRNNSQAESKGVEAELERQESDSFRWLANMSRVNTRDTRSISSPNGESAGAADWLANLAGFVRLSPRALLTSRLLHVGERHTLTGISGGYDTVDLTLTLSDAPAKGWTFRAGARNLLDDHVTYVLAIPSGQQVPFDTRTLWAQLSYAF